MKTNFEQIFLRFDKLVATDLERFAVFVEDQGLHVSIDESPRECLFYFRVPRVSTHGSSTAPAKSDVFLFPWKVRIFSQASYRKDFERAALNTKCFLKLSWKRNVLPIVGWRSWHPALLLLRKLTRNQSTRNNRR